MADSKAPSSTNVQDHTRPGFLSGWFGGSDASRTATAVPPKAPDTSTDSQRSASESIEAPKLRAIKTPHDESPISHPELSFTPSDIGIWEINKTKSTPTAEKGGTFGFWRK